MAEYFPHDYNASDDEKMIQMRMVLGWEAVGIYWGIVEKLYAAKGRLKADWSVISFGLQAKDEIIKKVVEDFGLFSVKDGNIFSESVDRRLAIRAEKSEKARQSAYARHAATDRQRSHGTPASPRFAKPTAQEATEYAKSIGFALDGAKFVDYYESKGWKIGNSPMKNWQAAVRTWKAKDGGASPATNNKPKPPQCSECWGTSNIRKRKRSDGTEWVVCLDCFVTFTERVKEKRGGLKPLKPSYVLGRK